MIPFRKPTFKSGGIFGEDIEKLWNAIVSIQPAFSPSVRTSRTTRGTFFNINQKDVTTGNAIIPMIVVSETRQWLKCQTLAQDGTDQYSWVAKPVGLRAGVAVTAETYPALTLWGEQFVGEKYLYRDTTERLKLWAPAGGDQAFGVLASYTPYERWTDGSVGVKADVDALRTALAGTNPFPSQIGNVDYIFSFEKIHPVYHDYNRVGASPHQGQPRTIYVTRFIPELERTADRPTEVPDDVTFESAFIKYIDLNHDARRWMPAHVVHPLNALVMNIGTPWATLPYLPQQYTDQTWGNSTPQIKTLLPSFWTELQP